MSVGKTRVCIICGEEKPEIHFYAKKDGNDNRCVVCHNKRATDLYHAKMGSPDYKLAERHRRLERYYAIRDTVKAAYHRSEKEKHLHAFNVEQMAGEPSLSAAIKGISEETAALFAGRFMGMRLKKL